MNYYERYCGDYGRDTAHLSIMEHGAYALMLDAYYSTERPLPGDYETLYRMCRAMTSAERSAVRSVAEQFFQKGADGLRRNPRAEREILKAAARIAAARANGAKRKGDRVDAITLGVGKPVAGEEMEASGLPSGLPSGYDDGSANGSPPDNPSGTYGESPIPHTPRKSKPLALAPLALPDWLPIDDWRAFDEMRRAKSTKAWTRAAQELALKKLEKLRSGGHDVSAILQQSVMCSYAGLFPVRSANAVADSDSPKWQ